MLSPRTGFLGQTGLAQVVDLLALSTGTSSILSARPSAATVTALALLQPIFHMVARVNFDPWTWLVPHCSKERISCSLAWRDKNLLCSNPACSLPCSLPCVSVVFQASSRAPAGPFPLFSLFCAHPVDSCLLFPDSLGKADPSLDSCPFSEVCSVALGTRWCISLFIRICLSLGPGIKLPYLVDHGC